MKIETIMNNISRVLVIVLISAMFSSIVNAEEYRYGDGKKQGSNLKQTTAGCSPASGYDWLDVNNVRARINTGGDMWWDLPGGVGAKYFIPKAGSATSMFSGALWIGGLDINNQLKLAAQRYRQVGVDYWTGPLTVDGTAAISASTCADWDRFFKITRAMVDEFILHCDPETGVFVPSDNYRIPSEIQDWPAHGDISKNQSYYLAPFYDNNGDGEYVPEDGDYPYYDITNELCHTDIPTAEEEFAGTVTGSILADQVIKGDQTLWWVFNDKGNIHTESGGAAIGMEIRAQAFGFATNDVINNMTFYSYEIINRSTFELTNTFFSPWVDTDLGFARDDFVGCDVGRGLGYCYNGKDVDGSGEVESYGSQPPAIGVDFFQGPYIDPDGFDNPGFGGVGTGPRFSDDPNTPEYDERCEIVTQDGLVTVMPLPGGGTIPTKVLAAAINGVNFGNGIIDDERFGMRRFVYHNNSGGNQGDPQIAPQYYNYLQAIWKDNTKMKFGGTGHLSGLGTTDMDCDFMFPFDSDPCNWGTKGLPPPAGWNQGGNFWSEETGNNGAPNPPEDRRFMQSAGPFTLKPGAVNYITVGIPWARATSGGAFASVELLRVVDDKCQALFDNCFKVIDGPTAPDLTFTELDRQLIVFITNSPASNNFQERYSEFDPNIIQPLPGGKNGERSDSIYLFEGYQIFQLANASVSVESIHNPDLARLVAQFDLKNNVTSLVNFYFDESLNANVPVMEVSGLDNGISHSFILTQDAFATGDVQLINNKRYFYLALAYAHNNYLQYSPDPVGYLGQTKPYLSGRKNIGDRTNGGQPYMAIPHKTVNGTIMNSSFGDSPQMTRIAGNGNGGMILDLTQETIDEILSKDPAGPDNLFGSPTYPIAYNPTYKIKSGPLNIKIIDPLTVTDANYIWWMDTLVRVTLTNLINDPTVAGDTASQYVSNWFIKNLETNDLRKSDTTIVRRNEQLFLDLGISVDVQQTFNPGPIPVGKVQDANDTYFTYSSILSNNNGLLEANIQYGDSSHQWLSGIQDSDEPASPLNWIRSGTVKDGDNPKSNDWKMGTFPDTPWDPSGAYEKILGGIWTPYSLTAYGNNFGQGVIQNNVGPAFSDYSKLTNPLSDIASVDIVFTSDKSLWTRAPVLEMGFDRVLAEGNAYRFALRAAPSVDKDGKPATIGSGPSENPSDPNYISDHGMGWFPGYAINIETGERLNIMFGEDSYLVAQNGRDMLFNPPPRNTALPDQFLDDNIWRGIPPNRVPVMGGKHYVYIMKHGSYTVTQGGLDIEFYSPAYDAGRTAVATLDTLYTQPLTFLTNYFFSNVMYTGMPMGVVGEEWLQNDAKIRIRINKPYIKGFSSMPLDTVYSGMDINNFFPMYSFTTDGLGVEKLNPEKQVSDLDLIRAVPNPYYAYSAYENNALDNRIKITNLPTKCTITIFNVSGTKVRQFSKDSPETFLEWDLKNFALVPISGGVYYIHVQSSAGEIVLKWFSVMRVPDLNTF